MPATKIIAGNAANANGQFGGGNDGAFQIIVGQDGAQRTVLNASTSGVLPYYNNSATISTTSTFSFNGTSGQIQLVTLTNGITVTMGAPSSITEGCNYTLIFKAGDTVSRVLTWNAAYKFPSGSPPLQGTSATVGGYDIISFIGGVGDTLYYTGSLSDVR